MTNLHLDFLPAYSPDYNIIELVWHSCKEYIAHRLFQSVDELKQLLDRLLNQGELLIKWHRKIKNKGDNHYVAAPTVAKLLEVEADLAAQEAQLNAQLVSIQEKRHSLKTVIDMFAPGDVVPTTSVVPPAQTPVTAAEPQSAELEVEPTALRDNSF